MKLHWSPRSPFVRKVMVFAHETGLVERLTCVRTVVAMKTPNAALLPDNPLSKIPTLLQDDGAPLYDSAVICEYLDTLHDRTKLFPSQGSVLVRYYRADSTPCFSSILSMIGVLQA